MASPYVSPVPNNVKVKRLDHGVDYQGNPGQKVVAIGNAVVDAVKSDPGGYGIVVYYTLTDGPHAGQQIFVGHARPNVKPGQRLAAGSPVATLQQVSGGDAKGLVGWVEVGLAKNGAPQYTKDQGGWQFQQLLVGAAKTPATPVATTQPQDTTGSVAAVPTDMSPPALGTPPAAVDPTVELPGTAQHYLPGQGGVAETWQTIQNDFPVPVPEIQRYIQDSSGG